MSSPVDNQPAIASQPQTKWLKRVLIPFWAIRVCLIVLLIIAYIVSLIVLNQQKNNIVDASSNDEITHSVYGGLIA